jgi:hypothetical protein
MGYGGVEDALARSAPPHPMTGPARRVASSHTLMIRMASRPAFFAPSTATQATGTPGGI